MRSNGSPLAGFGRGAQGLKGFRLVWYGGLPQMEQEPTECRRQPNRPWLSVDLVPKRHVRNDRKMLFLSDQSVVLPPEAGSMYF